MQDGTPAQNVGALGQVLRAVGGLTKPSGRGLFMFQSLIAGSSSAAIGGLLGASLAGWVFTTGAIGFVGGSCLGFVIGTVGYYRASFDQSISAFIKYPELLRHHLFIDLGMYGVAKVARFWGKDVQTTVEQVRRDVALQGMLIAAWHSAVPAIEVCVDPDPDYVLIMPLCLVV